MLHKGHHNIDADRSFFGTSHSKGAVDGLGAVVKKKKNVWLATVCRQYNTNSAEELYRASEKEVSNIKMKYMSAEEIKQLINTMGLTE